MKRQCQSRSTIPSSLMLPMLIVPILIACLVGCGSGGNGSGGGNPVVTATPTTNPSQSQTPVQSSINGRLYSVMVSLGATGQQFTANLRVGDNNIITGRAKIFGTTAQDGYTDLSGQVLGTPPSATLLIDGDYVFLQESNLSPGGLAAPTGPARKIHLSGSLADTIDQATEISLLINGTEFKGTITLDQLSSSVPASPSATDPAPTPKIEPTGSWDLIEGELEDYAVVGTVLDIKADGTYTIFVPSISEDGEIVEGKKEFSGYWRNGGDNELVFDRITIKDDVNLNGALEADETEGDDVEDNYTYNTLISGGDMTLTDDSGTIKLRKR